MAAAAERSCDFKIIDALGHAAGHNMFTAIFTVPVGLEAQLARNAVNARGAQFSLEVGECPGTISSTYYSNDPSATAEVFHNLPLQQMIVRLLNILIF